MVNMLIPMVIDSDGRMERSYDIYSRLLKDRIIFLTGEINDNVASLVCAQLLFLEAEDSKSDVYLYINSPGGVVTAGLAMYDTMQFITPNVNTVCVGQACSAASFLLAAGHKRSMLKHARVLLHQPSGGMQGQTADMNIYVQEMIKLKDILLKIYEHHTGLSKQKIETFFDRDTIFRADEAKKLGIIDEIIEKREIKEKITKNDRGGNAKI